MSNKDFKPGDYVKYDGGQYKPVFGYILDSFPSEPDDCVRVSYVGVVKKERCSHMTTAQKVVLGIEDINMELLQKQYLEISKNERTEDNDIDLWMGYVLCVKANTKKTL